MAPCYLGICTNTCLDMTMMLPCQELCHQLCCAVLCCAVLIAVAWHATANAHFDLANNLELLLMQSCNERCKILPQAQASNSQTD